MIDSALVEAFDRDGFVAAPNFFSKDEVAVLLANVDAVTKNAANMPDAEGRSSRLSLWAELGSDVFSAVSASRRVTNSVRALLRDDIYHWHSKVILKEPRVGGAWEWHQDYGYWYNDGCLYPNLVSCMVALDPATRENGCLKVIVGSHKLGRIEHGRQGSQAGADPERVKAIESKMAVHYCEAEAGSALFFHANTLHASEPNLSENPRRAFICCYNAFGNIPYAGGHGRPAPIPNIPEDAIFQWNNNVPKPLVPDDPVFRI